MYWYLQCYLSLLWKLMNTLVLRFVAMNASPKYSVIINFHENYYEYANFSVHRCKVDWCIGKHGWKSEIWRIPFLLAFVFYFLCCKCFREVYKCKLHFFPLKHDTVIIYCIFYYTYCFTIDHNCFTISCFPNKIISKQYVIPQFISIDLPFICTLFKSINEFLYSLKAELLKMYLMLT